MRARQSAFTLIELLVVIAIIAMLATLFSPAIARVMDKAHAAECVNNLRQVGVAVQLYLQDHDNHFPTIEGMPSSPIYTGDTTAGSLTEVLGPYGITQETLRCQADVSRENYFEQEGTSYMWRPIVDEELASAPKIYHRRGDFVPPSNRIRLLSDFTRPHNNESNSLMADGSVRTFGNWRGRR